mmetsp:Transcript_124703/g.349262  ORF Transcript_124703/g.349262 Transcript_124703/m.349262 type:complete len:380 (+) Transcript_124703:77-1216(+)
MVGTTAGDAPTAAAAAAPAAAEPLGAGAEEILELSVRVASGAEVALVTARGNETVRALKKKIKEAEETPTPQQRLLFGSRLLSNSQTLSEAGLKHGDIITLVRLRPTEYSTPPVTGTAVGDGITVLEEHLDNNFEPTEDDIDEYAEWLGLDPDADGDLLWIAREGLLAPLQDPWRACETPDHELFYFNFATGQSTWDHPIDDAQREKVREHKERRMAAKVRPPKTPRPSTTAPRRWLSRRWQDHRAISPRPSDRGADPDAAPASASSSSVLGVRANRLWGGEAAGVFANRLSGVSDATSWTEDGWTPPDRTSEPMMPSMTLMWAATSAYYSREGQHQHERGRERGWFMGPRLHADRFAAERPRTPSCDSDLDGLFSFGS